LTVSLSFTAVDARAQGFSSVSSAITAPTAAAAPVTAPTNPGSGDAAPSVADPPTAQLAALTPGSSGAGAGPNTAAGSARPFEQADALVVDKSDRKLYLLRSARVVAEYPVKLGLNPHGHKQHEGDFRTPEGKYALTRRNPRSDYFLSIQVSYPNREDVAWAKENGWLPGGLIMIHGQPNVPKRPPEFYASRDWTDGCIALSNADMVDVWLRTSAGLPIEIRP
jgi:hypothetical protein